MIDFIDMLPEQLDLISLGAGASANIRARRLPTNLESRRIGKTLAAMTLLRDENELAGRLLKNSPDPKAQKRLTAAPKKRKARKRLTAPPQKRRKIQAVAQYNTWEAQIRNVV